MGVKLCPTLMEEHTSILRVFENRVRRVIFGLERDEMTGEWRKPHNEELHNLYSSPNIIRMIKSKKIMWTGNVAQMEEKRNTYRILVGNVHSMHPVVCHSRKI
jgi:hypothetical protein